MDSMTLGISADEADAPIAAASPSVTWFRTCAEGDERRFAAVVLPYLADAYGLARRLTRNRADSEDVVQDACLRALHGIGNFAGGDARSWVLTIVRRTAYDWLNMNRPAAIVLVEDLEDLERMRLPEPDAGTAESRLIDREDVTLIQNAIAALPAHYRQTLVLRHLQGLTYREIADLTGISIGTVMSRLSRARRHLSRRFKGKKSGRAAREAILARGSRNGRDTSTLVDAQLVLRAGF
jgi:RNA polymerase sigma factor (sigma-70 family)